MQVDYEALAVSQHGLLSRAQLRGLEVTRGHIRAQLRSGRWVQRTHSVFSITTGPLSPEQKLWLAVLHAGPEALIGGLTAAKAHGLRGWERDRTTVLVPDQLSFEPLRGVHFVRTRRPLIGMRARCELPLCRIEPAILMFAAQEPNQRTAHGAVAAVVQQRLTNTRALGTWLTRLQPIRRARQFRELLSDIEGGADSLAEIDVRRACREAGIVPPRRQTPRRDRSGRRRRTDCEWDLFDGRVLVLEVHGAFHDDVLQAAEDRSRNRKLTTASRIVVTCSAYELRHDPMSVMEDLIALGVPRS